MGQFNDCIELAKQAIHNLLDEPIMDFERMIHRGEELVGQLKLQLD